MANALLTTTRRAGAWGSGAEDAPAARRSRASGGGVASASGVTPPSYGARDHSVDFGYLTETGAWVPLVLPPIEGRRLSAAQLVHQAVAVATACRIWCIGTALELGHPMTHDVLEAMRGLLGTDLETVDTRCAGSSVMVTARLLDPRAARAGGTLAGTT